MRPVVVAVAMVALVQGCGLFEPATHSITSPVVEPGASLSFNQRECQPVITFADAGWTFVPWDGGELPLLDAGISYSAERYVVPRPCDFDSLRAINPTAPGVGLGIDAPSDELKTSARLMVGEWKGTRDTYDGVEPVIVIFFENGEYSLAAGDCTTTRELGEQCLDHHAAWRLTAGNDVLSEGALSRAWMKQLQVTEQTLRFKLWEPWGTAGLRYELTRDLTRPCAGKNVASCP